jgi:hypothetical protein
MRGKAHITIPADEIAVVIAYLLPIDTDIFDANRQDGTIYVERNLEEGSAKAAHSLAIGGSSFGEEYYFEALCNGIAEILDLMFEANRPLAIRIKRSSQPGNRAQKGIAAHLHRSDKDQFFQAGKQDDIGVGNVICHQQVGSILEGSQALRMLYPEVNLKGLEKFPGNAAGVLDVTLAGQKGIFGAQRDPPSPAKEIQHQSQMAQEVTGSFHGGAVSYPEVYESLFPANC